MSDTLSHSRLCSSELSLQRDYVLLSPFLRTYSVSIPYITPRRTEPLNLNQRNNKDGRVVKDRG